METAAAGGIGERGKLVREVTTTGALGKTTVGVETAAAGGFGVMGKLVREVTATWALGTMTVDVETVAEGTTEEVVRGISTKLERSTKLPDE